MRFSVAALLLALAAVVARAQDPLIVEARLSAISAPDTSYNSRFFGLTVDIAGTTAAVGAPHISTQDPAPGSVYIYENGSSGWEEGQVLAAQTSSNDDFGWAVDLHGDWLLVAAPEAGDDGEVYLYEREGSIWALATTLTSPEPLDFPARFGESIALGVGVLAIGNGEDATYLYSEHSSEWSLTQTLRPPDPTTARDFGTTVVLEEDRLLVSTLSFDSGDATQWAVFAYDLIGGVWTETGMMTAQNLDGFARSGAGVALDGDIAIIGAPRSSGASGGVSGTVVVFEYDGSTWRETTRLSPSQETNGIGRAVSYDGRYAYVTAFSTGKNNGDGTGSLHIFDREKAWSETQVIDNISGNLYSSFWGRSIALSDDMMIVGSPEDYLSGGGSGAVFFFERKTGTWAETEAFRRAPQVAGEQAGWSVALGETRALLGAPTARRMPGEDRTGAAYVFELIDGDWQRSARLVANDLADADEFGASVALQDNRAFIGAPGHDPGKDRRSWGAVYAYEYAEGSWTLREKLTPASLTSERAGSGIELDGEHLVIVGRFYIYPYRINGASLTQLPRLPLPSSSGVKLDATTLAIGNSAAEPYGEILMYEWDGNAWNESGAVTITDGRLFERIGINDRFTLDSDRLFAASAFAVYVFEKEAGEWTQTDRVELPPPYPNGAASVSAMAADGDLLAVGQADGNLISSSPLRASGAVRIYEDRPEGWVQREKFVPSDAATMDNFGRDIGVLNERILVASPLSDPGGASAGAGVLLAVPGVVTTALEADDSRFISLPVPNPARNHAELQLRLPAPTGLRVTLVDALARSLATLHDGPAAADLVLRVETDGLAPGVYAVVVETEDGVTTRRFTVVR